MMSATTTTTAVNGAKILAACGYDARLTAAVIATQKDYLELLESIVSPMQIKTTAHYVAEIREGLGLESEPARRLSSPEYWGGREYHS
jgi:hypothetical protein